MHVYPLHHTIPLGFDLKVVGAQLQLVDCASLAIRLAVYLD